MQCVLHQEAGPTVAVHLNRSPTLAREESIHFNLSSSCLDAIKPYIMFICATRRWLGGSATTVDPSLQRHAMVHYV